MSEDMSANVKRMSSLADHVGIQYAPVRERRVVDEIEGEPDITRTLSERSLLMVDSGCLDPADAEAIRIALADTGTDRPSFF
jgi:hypothetical protein